MSIKKINVCSLQDPTNPKTWSGTPYRICSELSRIGCLENTFSSQTQLNSYETFAIKVLQKLYYKYRA